jgi:hypothetical protein
MWGLIAIGLSVSMVSVSFRLLSIYRQHGISGPDSGIYSTPEAGALSPATGAKTPLATGSAIAREMSAAQKAMQADRWADALIELEAANSKSPLTAMDEKTIYDSMGVVYLKQRNFQATQSAYEAALARACSSSGIYTRK